MSECNECKYWKGQGYVVMKGCNRFEPHNHQLPNVGDIVYWEDFAEPDSKKVDTYGNGECVNEGWIRKVCNHPDIAENEEHVVFTTYLLDGSPHNIDIRPKEEFEAARKKLIEDIQREFGSVSMQLESEGTYKSKTKPFIKKGDRSGRGRRK